MNDNLDADELLMLGLRASIEGAGGDALAYLKRAIEKRPDDAKAHWAIAAEYASLRMVDRARDHFARSLQVDPTPPVARFQYGLLMLTQGALQEARSIWLPLDALDAAHPVRLFKTGLLQMAEDQLDAALQSLQLALAAPGLDPALQRDILGMVQQIEATPRADAATAPSPRPAALAAAPDAPTPAAADEVSVESQLALHAYRNTPGGASH
jgi:tetratricopeptide (TPR) repeat protein